MPATDPDVIEAYELALRIISEFGHQLDPEECAQIAWRGETGDHGWLLGWQAPEWRPAT